MTAQEWTGLLDVVNAAGVVGLLSFIAFAAYRGGWLSRKTHDEIVAHHRERLAEANERVEEWRELALTGSLILDRVTQRGTARKRG